MSRQPDPDKALKRIQRALLIALELRASLLSRRKILPSQFVREAHELLANAHRRAAELGMAKAGANRAFTRELERAIGERQAQAQQAFLLGFARDLDAGRYAPKAQDGEGAKVRRARSILYALRLTGTANAAWAAAIAAQAVFGAKQSEAETLWVLGAAVERHCSQCPEEAARGWVPISLRGRHPGDGSTACLSRCKCSEITRDGRRSFSNG